MQHSINQPIFVVGSPRSGTSILTWCLGQHTNIITEESIGIGDLAVCHETKTALHNRSLFIEMCMRTQEFLGAFGKGYSTTGFMTEQSPDVPKTRWVDGTPEYSFHICGLRKLFPSALFVHIVRDVTSVVRSMLNFHRVSGVSVVTNEQEAYDNWFRAVSNCLLADEAYGPDVVFRLRYSDFVDQPESSLRSLLNFLGEPFCRMPLPSPKKNQQF
jgi:hypothetical protein